MDIGLIGGIAEAHAGTHSLSYIRRVSHQVVGLPKYILASKLLYILYLFVENQLSWVITYLPNWLPKVSWGTWETLIDRMFEEVEKILILRENKMRIVDNYFWSIIHQISTGTGSQVPQLPIAHGLGNLTILAEPFDCTAYTGCFFHWYPP